MAFLKRINARAKTDANTGFGTNSSNYGGRFITKDGDANVKKEGIGLVESISWYHTMLVLPRWKFMMVIFIFYLLVNLFFACVYCIIGVGHLNGITADNPVDKFGQAFFFSAQTFTTVGYGHISPSGFWASFVASVEALFGLLSFAIATGLFYGRFSKPKAFIRFSDNALIAPYKDINALMLRMTPFKNTNLTEAQAQMTLGMILEEDGKTVNRFYSLDLELQRINALTLSWTLVHPITEVSPFYNLTKEDFEKIRGEVVVYVRVFDDMFSTSVVKRTSYTFSEIVHGAKFVPMYSRSDDDSHTRLFIDKLNMFEITPLN
ncbi:MULTISPECIES: ion channel [Flavobacterium]|uniref:ion channel n=1 Tax=Flavobacterium TaxID=237 RepID=UPI001FCC8E30|nr:MULTISPECIES: ion channel [Flavobacterium]UOK42463.1 ion channel [Flavobacterium enshiense]